MSYTKKFDNCIKSYAVDGYTVADKGNLCSSEEFVLLKRRAKYLLIVQDSEGRIVDLKILNGRTSVKLLTEQYWNYRIDAIIKQYRDNGFFIGVLSRTFGKIVYMCKKGKATIYVTLTRNIEGTEYKIKEFGEMC